MENMSLADIIRVLRRRWLVLVLPLCVGVPLSLAVAALLPSVYVATARILVESQQIPDNLAQSTVGQSAAERIALIQQRLLTRQNLLDIAQQYGVFSNQPELSQADILTGMRAAATIQSTGAGRGRRANTTVTGVEIGFRANNPQTASRVANELVTRVLAQNAQERVDRASGTLAFFEQEVRRLSTEIDAQAARISAFKIENQGALPQTSGARQNELSMLRDRRFERLNQRTSLEEQIRVMREAMALGATSAGPGAQRSPQENELERLRTERLQRRATLAETHPVIRDLNARIAAIEQSLSTTTVASAATDGDAPAETVGRATTLLGQIEQLETQLANLENQSDIEEARIRELEEAAARGPVVEMELAALERAYAALQTQYNQAVLKRAQAETGERLEASQQAERLEVIEQAIPPERPVSPNRPMIIGAGTVVSGGLGLALAILLELLNRSVRSARDVEQRVGMRPIVSIPYIWTENELQTRRWRIRVLLLALAIGIPAALFAIDQFVAPLQVLIDRAIGMLQIDRFLAPLGVRL